MLLLVYKPDTQECIHIYPCVYHLHFYLYACMLFFFHSFSTFHYRPFTENVAAQFIYFFKSLYFIVSSFQIISGYPTKILGYFLGKKYTTVYGLLFSGYRTIPLLPELREVMDWMFTDTALSLFHWLRVQEIYAKLYLVKVRRQREKVCHSHQCIFQKYGQGG